MIKKMVSFLQRWGYWGLGRRGQTFRKPWKVGFLFLSQNYLKRLKMWSIMLFITKDFFVDIYYNLLMVITISKYWISYLFETNMFLWEASWPQKRQPSQPGEALRMSVRLVPLFWIPLSYPKFYSHFLPDYDQLYLFEWVITSRSSGRTNFRAMTDQF